MFELIDCHIHTERCGHATGCAAQYVDAARKAGITSLVFTEHLPLPSILDPDHRLSLAGGQIPRYAEEILSLAAANPDLEIIAGAEADWLPDHEDHCEEMRSEARAAGITVFLGSVHFIDTWAFDDPDELATWERVDVDEVYERYFEQWCAAATSGLFDVMAHPDLPKKFGHRPSGDVSDLYRQAAKAAAHGGVAVEASTAGWRKPVAELYPAPALLRAFATAGVPVTVGSDAHAPEEVGYRIEDAYAELRAAGYEQAVFPTGGRQWRQIALHR